MKVTDPDGRTWRVGRRWLPWRVRRREIDPLDVGMPDLDGGVDELPIVGVVLLALAGIVLLLAAIFFVLPAIALLVELLLVVVAAGFALVGKVVLRRPWVVEAVCGREVHEVRVSGWRASGRAASALADAAAAGRLPDESTRLTKG